MGDLPKDPDPDRFSSQTDEERAAALKSSLRLGFLPSARGPVPVAPATAEAMIAGIDRVLSGDDPKTSPCVPTEGEGSDAIDHEADGHGPWTGGDGLII